MYSVWIGSKVRDIHPEWFGYSRLGSRRIYAIYHLLFAPAGNPLHMDLSMAATGQISVACPVVVQAHPIGSRPICKDVPTEGCLQCRGVLDGLFKVDAEANLQTLLTLSQCLFFFDFTDSCMM